jgi:hypothetical protein
MLISGAIPFKNKHDRKVKYAKLRKELGESCTIWTEYKTLIYEYYVTKKESVNF